MKFSELTYQRPDLTAYQKLTDESAARIAAAHSAEEVFEAVEQKENAFRSVGQNATLAFIRHYQDSSDEFYQAESEWCDANLPLYDETAWQDALLSSPYRREMNERWGVGFLRQLEQKRRLEAEGKELAAREQMLMGTYQQIVSTMEFEYEGKTVREAELFALRNDRDPAVRRQVQLALAKGYLARKEELSDLLRQLVDTRIALAKANGFDSYLPFGDAVKGRFSYGEKELAVFTDFVEQRVVPLFRERSEKLRKSLGVDELSLADMGVYFREGNPAPLGDETFLMEQAEKMYRELSPDLARLMEQMVSGGYIDCAKSRNKIAGMGFATELAQTGMPFIFGNCGGTTDDVNVFVHEFGHAIQMAESMKQIPLTDCWGMPNDMAEIPSKTMEQVSVDYGALFFGERGEDYREYQQDEVLSNLCAYTMIHVFETWLYTHPEVSWEQQAQEFNRICARFYPEFRDKELQPYLEEGFKLLSCKAVYMFPRYVISYALSDVAALTLADSFCRDRKAGLERYLRLCGLGGTLDYAEALAEVGLKPAYDPSGFDAVEKILRKYL